MGTTIFFGAGQIGKYMLELWRVYGIEPDFFADNAQERWGTLYNGVRVLSIEELKMKQQVQIIITCKQADNVYAQLLDCGIDRSNIFYGNNIDDMLMVMESYMRENHFWDSLDNSKHDFACNVLFDLQCGFVLGGVEAWVLQMAKELSMRNRKVFFLGPDIQAVDNYNIDGIWLKYRNDISDVGRLVECLSEIRKNAPCNIVCNFAGCTFRVACIAKRLCPQEINLIAVVHSDDKVYYERYSKMGNMIDYCLVTCSMMEQQFLRRGMAREKILRLAWDIPCEEVLNREYSKTGEPIRIGYAGRLVRVPKRLDILIEVAKRLTQLSIDFRLEIAGTGEYEEIIRESLTEFGGQICLKGYIKREHIADFWKKQDIGINCSDLEGRCIAKAESMAAGAVPVITDTSSARDDVQDGYNGYVVSIGDIDGIVEKICYLYQHRDLLKLMGERSHQIILKQNAESNVDAMWDKILKK